MFDIGFWEMAFIGVIALVVIGPERLPGVARTVGLWVGKARRMVADIKSDVKKEMNEYDLQQVQELKSELNSASSELKNISEKASDTMGIREAGEQIKSSVSEVSDSLDIDGDLAGGKTAGGVSARKVAKPAAKKKATKKSTSKKKSTKKKATKKKSAGSKASAKKKVAKRKTSSSKTGKGAGSPDENKDSPVTTPERDNGTN